MKTRMTMTQRGAGVLGAGALLVALAACGDDEATVTTGGDNNQNQQDSDNGDDDTAGTDDNADADTADTDDNSGTDTDDDTDTDDNSGTDTTDTDDNSGTDTDNGTQAGSGTEIDGQQLADRISSPGEDALSSFSFEMTGDMDGQEVTATGQVDTSGGGLKMQLSMTEPTMGVDVQMIMSDEGMFMQMPPMTEPDMWIDLGSMGGGAMEMEGFDDVNITDQFDEYAGAASVEHLGEETINGTATDKYLVVTDEGEVNLWIGADDHIYQMAMSENGEDVTMTFSNWGEPVDIQIPSADQIQDMGDLDF